MKVYANAPAADMQIVISDGHRIAAHSHVIASASPVLENLVYMPRKKMDSERVIQILGVPSDVIFAFLLFVYSSRRALSSTEGREAINKHGVQLLALAHKYRIQWLKKECEIQMGSQLKAKTVVDVLQIARLCDVPRLRQRCLSFISKDFGSVQASDGWRFIQRNDPRLELEILQFLQETDQRQRRWRRKRAEQEVYEQLSEAMDCIEHICIKGCTLIGPHDKAPPREDKGSCTKFRNCEGLQLLIRHFATCRKKLPANGGACSHCKRMWQLFRLHSSLCERGESCTVPLCKEFKLKKQMEVKGEDGTWMLLVKKVVVARAMCSLCRRKRPEQLHKTWARSHTVMRQCAS